jgi:hypothetical protein
MRVRLSRAELPFDKALGLPLAVCVSLGLLMAAFVGVRAVRADDVARYQTDAALPPVYPAMPLVAWFNDDREEPAPAGSQQAAAAATSQMK